MTRCSVTRECRYCQGTVYEVGRKMHYYDTAIDLNCFTVFNWPVAVSPTDPSPRLTNTFVPLTVWAQWESEFKYHGEGILKCKWSSVWSFSKPAFIQYTARELSHICFVPMHYTRNCLENTNLFKNEIYLLSVPGSPKSMSFVSTKSSSSMVALGHNAAGLQYNIISCWTQHHSFSIHLAVARITLNDPLWPSSQGFSLVLEKK